MKIFVWAGTLLFLFACVEEPSFSQQQNQFPVSIGTADQVDTLRLLFAGDIMGHGPQIQSAELVKNERYDYTPCFEYIQPILASADLSIANLELSLPGQPPYLGYPMFRSPDDLVPALRQAGFDLLLTANNHCNDAFRTGVENAIYTLREHGFYQTGTFLNQEERELYYPLLIYRRGFKLAFLNYTFSTNKLRPVPPTVINGIDTFRIKADLAHTRDLQPDIVIVTMHWGKEYQLEEHPKQQQLAQRLFAWGADLVVGSHPHVVQPIKIHQIGGSEEVSSPRLVAYSLGNFISNQVRSHTDGGILLETTFVKSKPEDGARLVDWSYLPIWRQRGSRQRPYRVLPVANFEEGSPILSPGDLKALQRFAKGLRRRMKPYDCPEKNLKSP